VKFLGEADFSVMLPSNFTKEVDETLKRISNDIIRTEQYMDFLRNRSFRQTLLVRQDVNVNRNLGPASVMPFCVACPAKPVPNEGSANQKTFQEPSGRNFNVGGAMAVSAFEHLAEIWPQSIRFEELLEIARKKSNTNDAGDADALASCILTLFAGAFCTLRTEPVPFVSEISEKPIASSLAREQSKTREIVVNQLHDNMRVDVLSRNLLQLMDGTRNKSQLIEELAKLVQNGTLVIHKDGKQLKEGPAVTEVLTTSVDTLLSTFAKGALLVG